MSFTVPLNYQGQSVDAIDQTHQVRFNWNNKYFVKLEHVVTFQMKIPILYGNDAICFVVRINTGGQ